MKNNNNNMSERFELLTAVLSKIQDFWDVILFHCACTYQLFKGSYSPHLQGQAV
jgi:hypothetical protein